MSPALQTVRRDDDIAAELTEIAYRALLEQGLSRAFVDVELDLWRSIRGRLAARSASANLEQVA